jgi:hypothetical protein
LPDQNASDRRPQRISFATVELYLSRLHNARSARERIKTADSEKSGALRKHFFRKPGLLLSQPITE